MGVLCAGMTSTQRSESANHMLKALIQKAAPMHLFVSKFNELQKDRNTDESTQDFATKQVIPFQFFAQTRVVHLFFFWPHISTTTW